MPHDCRLKWLSLALLAVHKAATLEYRCYISQMDDASPSNQDLGPMN